MTNVATTFGTNTRLGVAQFESDLTTTLVDDKLCIKDDDQELCCDLELLHCRRSGTPRESQRMYETSLYPIRQPDANTGRRLSIANTGRRIPNLGNNVNCMKDMGDFDAQSNNYRFNPCVTSTIISGATANTDSQTITTITLKSGDSHTLETGDIVKFANAYGKTCNVDKDQQYIVGTKTATTFTLSLPTSQTGRRRLECDEDECSTSSAQATCAQTIDGSRGGPFACGTGFKIRANPASINCAATPCVSDAAQKTACCDAETLSSKYDKDECLIVKDTLCPNVKFQAAYNAAKIFWTDDTGTLDKYNFDYEISCACTEKRCPTEHKQHYPCTDNNCENQVVTAFGTTTKACKWADWNNNQVCGENFLWEPFDTPRSIVRRTTCNNPWGRTELSSQVLCGFVAHFCKGFRTNPKGRQHECRDLTMSEVPVNNTMMKPVFETFAVIQNDQQYIASVVDGCCWKPICRRSDGKLIGQCEGGGVSVHLNSFLLAFLLFFVSYISIDSLIF